MLSLCQSATPNEAAALDAANRLLRLRAALGITRVADLTGLDVVGIPVVQAVRPASRANAVSQGKGMCLAQAVVSAIMEAAEQCFAERVERSQCVRSSARKLGIPATTFAEHLRPGIGTDWADLELPWVEGIDLIAGKAAFVPLELVHTAYLDPPLASDGLFFGSTTGLACHFQAEEAHLHALLECVEKDAIGRAMSSHGFFHRRRLDPEALSAGCLEPLLSRFRSAGLLLGLWVADAIGDVPVIWCQIMEDGSRPPVMPRPADGFGAGTSFPAAARAAMLEAAQSRLAALAGARDDMTRSVYSTRQDRNALEAHRELLLDGPLEASALVRNDGSTFADRLDRLLGRLCEAGVANAILVELDTEPCPDIVACRIVVPDFLPWREA